MKRTKKSQERAKFLFILVILTAILSITATYAWFSTQRDVEISNLKINVETAENLQISLDGENWSQTITIENMKQLYGTHTAATGTTVYQAKSAENRNYIPTELLPVSTVGTLATGNLVFVKGKVDGVQLKEITKCSEADITTSATIATKEGKNADHPYLVFDIYLRNLSRRATGSNDELHLDQGSKVWIDSTAGKTGTGLEYSSRVAFVPYGNTADLTATGTVVRALTASGSESVSIWEPNDKNHTQYVVNNNKRGIKALEEAIDTYAVKDTAVGKTISDVNSTSDELLSKITTIKPAYTLADGTTASAALTKVSGSGSLSLQPNKISKVRVYIWLEGQDPDCIDLASTGKQLNATIRLIKPENKDSSAGVSYQ